MNRLNIGLIGYGIVGSGVAKLLKDKRSFYKKKYDIDCELLIIADRSIDKKNPKNMGKTVLTRDIDQVIKHPEVDVVVELIGGMKPAKDIVISSLKNGKHVVTANKELIANAGPELFEIAHQNNRSIYFESAVGAGIPIIETITEGIAGNEYEGIYGIINGTCNYILTEMTRSHLTFKAALELAQKKGYAESDPTLDVNGMDAAHKLSILVYLAMGRFVPVKEIYTEGIAHISDDDIEYATSMGYVIKLLAIAKMENGELETRVSPTMIPEDHPLASVNGVLNAIYLDTEPLGPIKLEGNGAGQMAAASGVISDIINIGLLRGKPVEWIGNYPKETNEVKLLSLDKIETEYYIRLMVMDRPGQLSKITGILGNYGISIASVAQRQRDKTSAVPVILLTHMTKEGELRKALNEIGQLPTIKVKPVAIRLERST